MYQIAGCVVAERLVKVVGKHQRGCWREWGPIAYGKHGAPVISTQRRSGRRGTIYRTWVRFLCNNTECKAELHVEQRFILGAALNPTSTRNPR